MLIVLRTTIIAKKVKQIKVTKKVLNDVENWDCLNDRSKSV